MTRPEKNRLPEYDTHVRLTYSKGHGGSGMVRFVGEVPPHGFLCHGICRDDLAFVPWSHLGSWEPESKKKI